MNKWATNQGRRLPTEIHYYRMINYAIFNNCVCGIWCGIRSIRINRCNEISFSKESLRQRQLCGIPPRDCCDIQLGHASLTFAVDVYSAFLTSFLPRWWIPGMSAALHSVGLLDVLSGTSAEPSIARLVSMPICAASLRNPVRNAD